MIDTDKLKVGESAPCSAIPFQVTFSCPKSSKNAETGEAVKVIASKDDLFIEANQHQCKLHGDHGLQLMTVRCPWCKEEHYLVYKAW